MSSPRLTMVDVDTTTDLRRRFKRSAVPDPGVRDAVIAVCDDVSARGDSAVRDYAERFGGGFRKATSEELDEAVIAVGPELVAAIRQASVAIEEYHRELVPRDISVTTNPGVQVARKWAPLRRVGCYVPGGKAAYPSTVLMTVIPAKVAGVEEVVVCSPEGPGGEVSDALLAACRLAGATEVWLMCGAQAIAALAYGTETVAEVDKIVGPGNAWVTAAKLAVFGATAIDLPAGPSEVLVLADSSADPELVAIDLLCQAEHGPDSPAILVTTDPTLLERVERELDRLLPLLERAAILEQALRDHGQAILCPDRETAIEVANAYASEHVTILTQDPVGDAKSIIAAGSVYVGRWSPESAGDYATGANHVLPTGGLARACGPLSVEDFGSWRQEQTLDRTGLEAIVGTISTLATAEGLTAHRMAATIRLKETRPETRNET